MAQTEKERAIDELKAAVAELESPDGLEQFVEGHGLQSRYFAFEWNSPKLEIDFRLPVARVLSDEAAQQLDNARIGAACRLAILLLAADEGILLADGETRLSVSADEEGEHYAFYGRDGEEVDAGDDWSSLVARLESSFPDSSNAMQIIWP